MFAETRYAMNGDLRVAKTFPSYPAFGDGPAGLHTGECELRGKDIGVHELKGVPGEWRLSAVTSTRRSRRLVVEWWTPEHGLRTVERE